MIGVVTNPVLEVRVRMGQCVGRKPMPYRTRITGYVPVYICSVLGVCGSCNLLAKTSQLKWRCFAGVVGGLCNQGVCGIDNNEGIPRSF